MASITERAVLAGGCFWDNARSSSPPSRRDFNPCWVYRRRCANATYRNHGSHAEAIEIIFVPREISYRDLLEFFFQIHDPSTRDR